MFKRMPNNKKDAKQDEFHLSQTAQIERLEKWADEAEKRIAILENKRGPGRPRKEQKNARTKHRQDLSEGSRQ